MSSEERTTGLFQNLENADMTHGFKNYMEQHPDTDAIKTFHDYINTYVATHEEISISYIANHCGFGENYAREIMRGDKNGSRDRIIALCITAKMNLKETRRGLKLAGFGDLYPKIARDMAIIICINNECYNVGDVNDYLDKNGCETLK